MLWETTSVKVATGIFFESLFQLAVLFFVFPFLLQLLFSMNLASFKIWKQKCIVLRVLTILTKRAQEKKKMAMQTISVAFAN